MPLQTETLPSWSRDDDRIAALGGHASVKQREDTTTVIVAKIPL
jgi:hypothetical protein